jgi:hypothetical protein
MTKTTNVRVPHTNWHWLTARPHTRSCCFCRRDDDDEEDARAGCVSLLRSFAITSPSVSYGA